MPLILINFFYRYLKNKKMAHRTLSFSSYVSSNTIKTENLDKNNEEDHKAYLQEKIEPWLTWSFYHLSGERPYKPLV